MREAEIPQSEVEIILQCLSYDELSYLNYNPNTRKYFYEGYLDTFYKIQVLIYNSRKVEIWDCIYDEENYVQVAIAYLNNGKWKIIEE